MLLFLYSKLCKILFFTLLAVFHFLISIKKNIINNLILSKKKNFKKKFYLSKKKNIMSEANYNYLFKFIIIGDTCKKINNK